MFRSSKGIYAQVIDDDAGVTLAAASTLVLDGGSGSEIRKGSRGRQARGAARSRGRHRSKVVFDRGGYLYHGRVKALADGAREGGLEF